MRLREVRSENGTSMIEFALVLPVVALLLVGLIEFGRYMYFGIMTAHAARAGAQYGAQTTYSAADTTGMKNAALADAPGLSLIVTPAHFCEQNGAVVGCVAGLPPSGTTYYVQVQATGTFHSLLKYPGIPQAITLTSIATMRVANQ